MQPFAGRGRFFLLRHGETEWNRELRVMGRQAVPLGGTGRAQMASLLPLMAGLAITQVWTSPLPRARLSAELVGEGLGGLRVEDEEGLTEVDYAGWEGRTFESLLSDPAFLEFQRDPVSRSPGGGESLLELRERVYAAMERIARKTDGPALIVSHGDPIRVLLCGCLALDLAHCRRLRVDTGSLSAIELTGNWAEVEFVNVRPDLARMLESGRALKRRS